MELWILFPMLFMLCSGIFHTAVPASVSTRHSRPKRCSCATFLDKECVYFCHLDIIWVNTPERTVSYGLGNAPRRKRSAQQTSRAADLLRCQCAQSTDGTCMSFCNTSNPLRRKAARDKVLLPPAAVQNKSAEKTWQPRSLGLKGARATRMLQLFLKKWRMRLSHNTEYAAS
ncbi:endothelin-1 [Tachysurus ichikawai]